MQFIEVESIDCPNKILFMCIVKVEFECTLTLRQIKARIRKSQKNENAYRLERKFVNSETLCGGC